jgi:hypothetical protein
MNDRECLTLFSHKTMARILMFNFKGDRNARSLLEPLVVRLFFNGFEVVLKTLFQ